MIKYIFKILIYTDNEFSIPYVPAGMTFDWDKTYSLTKEYSDIAYAIADIEDICLFLRQNIRSEYCFVDDYWAGLIDEFLKKVDKIKIICYYLIQWMEGYYGS